MKSFRSQYSKHALHLADTANENVGRNRAHFVRRLFVSFLALRHAFNSREIFNSIQSEQIGYLLEHIV